jgi:hypothetical protein
MGDSEPQISSAETFLGGLSASDFCIDPVMVDDTPSSEEEVLKERVKLREENRRRLQISFLGSVSSEKEEDLQLETKSQILKLLLQYESSINHSDSQKSLVRHFFFFAAPFSSAVLPWVASICDAVEILLIHILMI